MRPPSRCLAGQEEARDDKQGDEELIKKGRVDDHRHHRRWPAFSKIMLSVIAMCLVQEINVEAPITDHVSIFSMYVREV